MAQQKLRTAVVGVGYLGRFHAQKYKALSESSAWSSQMEFVGVCDLSSNQAQAVASELKCQAFTDAKSLIGKVDAVTIATITPVHFELAKMFLEAGVHVNIEKPITVKTSEAQMLLDIALAKQCVIAVGHSERFSPLFARLKAFVKAPIYVELFRHAPYKPRGAEVSVLHDLAIHDVDLAFQLCGTKYALSHVAGAKLATSTTDWCQFTMKFSPSLQALVSVSRVSPEVVRLIRVYERDRVIIANFQTGEIQIQKGTDPLITETVGKGDNLLMETEAFISSLIKQTPVVVSGEDGYRALKCLELVQSHLQVVV